MSYIINKHPNSTPANYYDYLFVDLADPRTNDWFLINSPVPLLFILVMYLGFVLNWGPRFMKDRKPFNLGNTLIVYNGLQVLFSSFIVYEAVDGLWFQPDFSFLCQPVDFSLHPRSLREARDFYLYFLCKVVELLDTVFFVLRKKNSQITFLHLYHHTVMPMISWGATKYYPGGHGSFIGVVNSFVHIVMYFYYMLAACGPKFQRFLWWKKYITVLQMTQFLLVFLHNLPLLWIDCGYPKISLVFTLSHSWIFLGLFQDFYVKAYKKKLQHKSH